MKKLFLLALLHIIWCSAGYTQTSNGIFTRIRAEEYLRIGSNSTQKITGFDLTIPSIATYDKVPTTKAIKDWVTGSCVLSGGAAGGDLSGTYPNPTVSSIRGIPVSNTAPTTGQILKYNGTQYVPSADAGGASFPLLAPNGSSSAPSYSFANATGTGIYGGDALNIITKNETGDAQNIQIKAGDGTVNAGAVGIIAGGTTDGTGGNVNLTAGDSQTDGGGGVSITSGNSNSANAGQVSLIAGASVSGNGGGFNLSAGSGAYGGGFYAVGGNSSADAGEAGSFTMLGGSAFASSEPYGGGFSLGGGSAVGPDGIAGGINITGGTGQSGSLGGRVDIAGGGTDGASVGGVVQFTGGQGTSGQRAPVKVFLSPFVFASFTTTQRDALGSIDNGSVIYNTTTNKLQVRAAATWVDLH